MTTKRIVQSLRVAVALAAAVTMVACGTTPTVPAPAPAGSNPATTQSTAPATPQVKSISAPATLGGRPKLTDATHTKLVADTEAAIKAASPTATSVFVAYYGTADATKNKIYMFGATMSADVSAAAFDASVADIAQLKQGVPFTDVQTPDQGALGGSAKCGLTKINDMPTALCGWYVKNFLVFVLWYNHQTAELVAELPKIRGEVETR